jgi:hypothetical protein
MSTKTKIVVAAALIIGTASAALAGDTGKKHHMSGSRVAADRVYHPEYFAFGSKPVTDAAVTSHHIRGGYVGPEVSDRFPTTGVRPFTEFEWTWFDYQNHDTGN